MQPTRTARSGHGSPGFRPAPSLFGLAPGGVCRAACVAAGAVRSYRTVSPLPRLYATHRGGLFSVALSLGSRPPDVIRHRMPMEPGLSSQARLSALARAAARPTDAPAMGSGRADVKCLKQEANARPSPQLGWIDVRRASRAARRALRVATVDMSMTPSIRSGRKWRWKAATASRVVPSRYPLGVTP
jgi:hypothetical protein